ncbi:type II secretion system F family protein [Streptomyces sp. NRRL B-1347]|uniref:type II secretion system F family protein n=1 Tax=Streptomyces sp. NRRL B-1347 TaxID=1476877 RepID=UPI0004C74D14|nr:type II secretion system F family protein [Streptomyces sp. NRRL B-1347]
MSVYVPLAALLGVGIGVGVLLVVRGGHEPPPATVVRAARHRQREHHGSWLAGSLAAGLLTGAFTGWVAGGLLAAMATWSLPRMLAVGAVDKEELARIEGVAGWTEMVRDTLAAAAGLEQAITATADAAPKAVRPQILELSARLERGERLAPALSRLAGDLDDPTADLVLAALTLASQHQARQLASLLGELAATARAQVAMRQRIDAARARMRTTLRVVVTTTLSFAGGLVVFNPTFLTPYDAAAGQLVLLLIGALFTVAFSWLRRLARMDGPERFLVSRDGSATAESDPAGRREASS